MVLHPTIQRLVKSKCLAGGMEIGMDVIVDVIVVVLLGIVDGDGDFICACGCGCGCKDDLVDDFVDFAVADFAVVVVVALGGEGEVCRLLEDTADLVVDGLDDVDDVYLDVDVDVEGGGMEETDSSSLV